MKNFIFGLVVLGTVTNYAVASPQIKKAISDTASSIQLQIFESQADEAQLTEALHLLQSSLSLISSPGNQSNAACVEWAYALYYQSQSSEQAQANAARACRGFVDLEIAKWLYAKFYQSQTAAESVTHATDGAKRAQGKLPIIEFAYAKYYQSDSASVSASKASTGASQVLANTKTCLELAYTNYYKTKTSSESMDLAFRDCRP